MSNIILLSGFLGSGKTTFMKHILKELKDFKLGIIVNEIGKVSIDGISLTAGKVERKELNNGSIFCACIKENFIQALVEFKKYQVDYLLIEASGISDPANINKILSLINEDRFYRYLGNICILDGVYFTRLMKVYPVIEKQIMTADVIILNKTDLISESQKQECQDAIRTIRPDVRIVESAYCNADLRELMTRMKAGEYDDASMNTPENKPSSFFGEYEGSIPKKDFLEFLESIKKESIRIKGFVNLEGHSYHFNVVGETIEISDYEEPLITSKLVFISYQGFRYYSIILKIWKRFIDHTLTLL